MAREINKQMDDFAVVDDPMMIEIVEYFKTQHVGAVERPSMLRELLMMMNKTSIMKVLAVLDGRNNDVKIENLKKLIYKNQLSMIMRKEEHLKAMKDAMTCLTKYMVMNGYAGEDCLIAWAAMKKDAMDANTAIDKATGRAEAEAGDAPIAEPAARGLLGRVFG